MFIRGVKSRGKLDTHVKGHLKERRNILQGEIVFLESIVDRTSSKEL